MQAEQKPSIGRNYLFSILYQLVALSMPLVTTPYLSRVLGAYELGRFSFAGSIVSYFLLLATFGTSLYGQRLIARVRHLPKVRTHFFLELFLLRVITTVVAAVAYAFIVLPRCGDPFLYAVLGVEILGVALDASWFLQGMERFAPITLCAALSRVAAAICVFLFVREREDLVVYCILFVAAKLLSSILLMLWVRRGLVRVKRWHVRLGAHAWLSTSLFVGSIAIGLYTVMDKTMIGLITRSAVQNGYYEQAQRIVHVIIALVTAMGVVIASRVAFLWKTKKKEELCALLLRSFRLMLALSLPAAAGLVLISPRLVPIFLGKGFAPTVPVLAVLALLIPIIGVSNVIGIQLFAATGREKLLTLSVCVGALVNLGLNFLLIPRHAALGAAIASVLAELAVSVVQLFLVRRELPVGKVLQMGMRYLVFADVMAAIGLVLHLCLGDGIPALLLIIGASSALYLLLLVLFRDPVLALFTRRRDQE